MDNLKAEQLGSAKWRVLAIPFGGPMKGGKDLDGEWFDHDTDIKARWFKERPVLFHHGQDPEIGDEDLGVEDDLEEKKDGHWATIWLDRSHRYWAQVDSLIRGREDVRLVGCRGPPRPQVQDRDISTSGRTRSRPSPQPLPTPTPASPPRRRCRTSTQPVSSSTTRSSRCSTNWTPGPMT